MLRPDGFTGWIPAFFGCWALVLGLVVWLPPDSTVGATEPGTAGATAAAAQVQGLVGSETCQICHETQYSDFRRSVHFQTETGDFAVPGCEACHGPGERHIEDPETVHMIFAAADIDHNAQQRAGQCLTCHADGAATFDYRSSDHLKGAIDCAGCHQPHGGAGRDHLRMDAGLESCLGCHQELRAEFNTNERHRVLEGMVTCSDCHNQHGPSTRARLGGFKQEICTDCHTEKQGPYLYEHLSVAVEGCTACHQPHGSVNRHMLFTQEMGELCYSCHVEVPGFHTAASGDSFRFNTQTNCVNCHSTIHGSNLHPRFLR
jgi:DmsE family decaheme c-type cytochrome